MKVLVTGASGFLGQAIISEIGQENHDIYSLVSFKNKNSQNLPNVYQADISDYESLLKLEEIENCAIVIHSAGLAHQFGKTSDEKFWDVNVRGTENIARLAVKLKTKHFILISSVSVYGDVEKNGAIDENRICNPQGIYAKSKLESEVIARKICASNQIGLTIIRPATIIGENDRGNTARLIEAIDRNRFIWIGKGENRKSLVYKQDVAKACLKVFEKKSSEVEVFNVTAESVKMNYIVSEIEKSLQKKTPKFKISVSMLEKIFEVNKKTINISKIEKLRSTVDKWISEDVFSSQKIFKEYGFRAETKIAEALRRQVEYYLEKQKTEK